MVDLLYAELLKLKRSRMLPLSAVGSAVAPIMVVLSAYIQMKTRPEMEDIPFEELFFNTNLYLTLLIGVPLYGVVTAYLFNREYAEDTLKHLLTIPVSRTGLVVSKMTLLLLWIMTLTMLAWTLTLALGAAAQFTGLTAALAAETLREFAVTGAYLFLLSTPAVFTAVVLKNYVPTIVLTIVITLVNVMVSNSEYKGLVPWTAAFDIAHGTLLPAYPPLYSHLSVWCVSLGGFAAVLIYFRKADIH